MTSSTLRLRLGYSIYPVLVMGLCACFLFYKYILQVYPSIITHQLMQEFQLTGAGLGNLAATFYYATLITQVFVGVLVDKYSTRLLASAAILACALGLVLFSQTHSLFIAQLSRGLMGMGVAFATVSYMKLAAVWFAPHRYAFVSGLLATAAMCGAVFGQAPLSFFVNALGWRDCLYITGWIGLILALLFVWLVRDGRENYQVNSISRNEIASLLKNKQNWLLTFYSGLAFSPIAVFGGLWGNPFLQQAYHLNNTEAATMVSFAFIGLGLGSPLLGMLSDFLQSRRKVMFYSTFISCLALTTVLYAPFMSNYLASILLFIFGFGLGSFMLVFSIGKEINIAALTGTVIAMINSSDALLDGITEPGIGKLLDSFWDGKIVNGVHYFSLHSYQIALSLLPIYLLLATLLLLWVKEAPGGTR